MSDEKIVKSFKVHRGDGSIICLEILDLLEDDEENLRASELIVQSVFDIYKNKPDTIFSILIDMSQQKKGVKSMPKSIQNQYDKITRHDQTKKVAVVGSSAVQNIVIKIIMLRERDKVNWFTNKNEATEWLRVET